MHLDSTWQISCRFFASFEQRYTDTVGILYCRIAKCVDVIALEELRSFRYEYWRDTASHWNDYDHYDLYRDQSAFKSAEDRFSRTGNLSVIQGKRHLTCVLFPIKRSLGDVYELLRINRQCYLDVIDHLYKNLTFNVGIGRVCPAESGMWQPIGTGSIRSLHRRGMPKIIKTTLALNPDTLARITSLKPVI